jgi:hypothetical protein
LICLPKLQIEHHGAQGASSAELQIQHKSGFGKQDEFFMHTHQVKNLPTITQACSRFRIQGLGNLYDSGIKGLRFGVYGAK